MPQLTAPLPEVRTDKPVRKGNSMTTPADPDDQAAPALVVHIDHRQGEQILAAARRRLQSQLRSLDPVTSASAEMSLSKGDGKFFQLLEDLLRECVTIFDSDELVARACARLGHMAPPEDPAESELPAQV